MHLTLRHELLLIRECTLVNVRSGNPLVRVLARQIPREVRSSDPRDEHAALLPEPERCYRRIGDQLALVFWGKARVYQPLPLRVVFRASAEYESLRGSGEILRDFRFPPRAISMPLHPPLFIRKKPVHCSDAATQRLRRKDMVLFEEGNLDQLRQKTDETLTAAEMSYGHPL